MGTRFQAHGALRHHSAMEDEKAPGSPGFASKHHAGACRLVVRAMPPGARLPGFKSQLCHLAAVGLWASVSRCAEQVEQHTWLAGLEKARHVRMHRTVPGGAVTTTHKWPRSKLLYSLDLSFLLCEMGVTALPGQGCCDGQGPSVGHFCAIPGPSDGLSKG